MGETPRKIVFVSFWTTKYKDAAARLKASFDSLGLESDINEIPDNGWKASVRFKPTYILQMMNKHLDAYAIVWIDADGNVLQKPTLFWEINEDLAAHFLLWRHKNAEELLSGTLYVRNTEEMRSAVSKWIETLAKAPMTLSTPEQSVLHKMLPELGISVYKLPEPYCRILKEDERRGRTKPPEDSVVVHYQFSRTTRFDGVPAPFLSGIKNKQAESDTGDKAVREKKPLTFREKEIHRREMLIKKRAGNKPSSLYRERKQGKETRPPDAIVQAIRRKKILIGRVQKREEERERARINKLLFLAAHKREDVKYLEGLKRELDGKTGGGGLTGGVRGHEPSMESAEEACAAINRMRKASRFDKILPPGMTVVIMGNSPSIKTIPPEVLSRTPTIGCNRALRWKEFQPDFLFIGDREPYCQERDSGRLESAAKEGVKIVLSDSIFDPRVLLRGPYDNPDRRAQLVPEWESYIYEIGPRKKDWKYDDVPSGKVKLPVNIDTFSRPVISCLNIAGSLLQAAAIIGASRIAVIGIEMQWESDDKSHFFGNGRAVGAYPQDASLKVILSSLQQVKNVLKDAGISVINLSPQRDTPFGAVFHQYPIDKFVRESATFPVWNPCLVLGRQPRNDSERQRLVASILSEGKQPEGAPKVDAPAGQPGE